MSRSDREDTAPLEALLASGGESADFLDQLVRAANEQLGMDLAYMVEFVEKNEVFRKLAGDKRSFGFEEEMAIPLAESYCQRLVQGDLPSIVANTTDDQIVRDLPITKQADIGAYIGVPIRLRSGRVYGTLCGVSHAPEPTLRERDVRFLQVLANLAGNHLDATAEKAEFLRAKTERIKSVLEQELLTMVFQPIRDLDTGETSGLEALSRFELEPKRTPDKWFAEAWEVGLGSELELLAVRKAVSKIDQLPGELYLSVNVSPETLRSEPFTQLVQEVPALRLVVEVTEHAVIDEYGPLAVAVTMLRQHGVRIAVDDMGAGYAGLNHILQLGPDIAKLDIYLTRDVDRDAARQALVSSTVGFANRVGLKVVAEGIETEAEQQALRVLGVSHGQGFHLGRPGPLRI